MYIALLGLQIRNAVLLSTHTLKYEINTWRARYHGRITRTFVTCLDFNGRANYTNFDDYMAFVDCIYSRSTYRGLSLAVISGPICSRLDVQAPVSQRFEGVPQVNGTRKYVYFVHLVSCGFHHTFGVGTPKEWAVLRLGIASLQQRWRKCSFVHMPGYYFTLIVNLSIPHSSRQ